MEYRIQRTEDYLSHHGVAGQKWGIRRYQNEDGSYKPGAEGRYDPEPSGNGGRTLKNRVKAKAGVYKDGDGNPYVSEKRRKNRKNEYEQYEKGLERDKEKAAKKAAERAEKQRKKDEKMSKNSYKKIAGKYVLKNIGYTIAGNVIGKAVEKKTGNTGLGLYTNAGIQTVGKTANMIKSGKEAIDLHKYRKRKSARHSDFSQYDCLYHSDTGAVYGIRRI